MVSEQDWQLAIEEFGDEAHKIFTIFAGDASHAPVDNRDVEKWMIHAEKLPLPELFAHDVEVYGDSAYLMWDVDTSWILDFNFAFNNNYTVECALGDKRSLVKRKTSAALPFDLERAKAGDISECRIYTGEWLILKSFIECSELYIKGHYGETLSTGYDWFSLNENKLRMKYPPKIGE